MREAKQALWPLRERKFGAGCLRGRRLYAENYCTIHHLYIFFISDAEIIDEKNIFFYNLIIRLNNYPFLKRYLFKKISDLTSFI